MLYNNGMSEKVGFKSVQEVAAENGCNVRTVQKWCLANDVPYVGAGRGKRYLVSPEHGAAFAKREKPGRRWPAKERRVPPAPLGRK